MLRCLWSKFEQRYIPQDLQSFGRFCGLQTVFTWDLINTQSVPDLKYRRYMVPKGQCQKSGAPKFWVVQGIEFQRFCSEWRWVFFFIDQTLDVMSLLNNSKLVELGCDTFGPKHIWSPDIWSPIIGPQLIGPSGQTVPNQFCPHGQMVPKNLVPLDKWSPTNSSYKITWHVDCIYMYRTRAIISRGLYFF